MGKDLKGRKCGKGISQRKDGLFVARFVNKRGARQSRCFKTLLDAKNWLADSRYEDRHGIGSPVHDMTVDDWFEEWINNVCRHLSENGKRNYRERYKFNIQPVIGHMALQKVTQLDCQRVIDEMNDALIPANGRGGRTRGAENTRHYAGSTIRQTYETMGTMFKSAVTNRRLSEHPMGDMTCSASIRPVKETAFLTLSAQRTFIEAARRDAYFSQYMLVLETGLRTGELVGLTWDDIDWDRRTLTVRRTLEYRHNVGCWRVGPPKTSQSYRTIPLTSGAYQLLSGLYQQRDSRKVADGLSSLSYRDRGSNALRTLNMGNLVFLGARTGEPVKNSAYDSHLYSVCDRAGIPRFCMHALRHTYATRCIEAGMPPKVLQKLLGHAQLSTTVDRYVHVTDDFVSDALGLFEEHRSKNQLDFLKNGTEMVQ